MKKFNLLLLFLFFCQNLFSQNTEPFVPVGATWTYAYRYYANNKIEIIKSTCTKDTLVMGKKCSEIKTGYGCYYLGATIYMYKEDKKVFVWNKERDDFSLLYDFSQNKFNDAWVTDLKSNIKKANDVYFSVQSVDSIKLFNGKKIRQFIVNIGSYDVAPSNQEPYKNVRIYENIGTPFHIMPAAFSINTCDDFTGSINELRCYEDKNVGLLKFTEIDCNETSSVFVSATAAWTYSYKSKIPGLPNTFPKTKCLKDTLILGKQCSKMQADYNACSPYGNPFFLSNENNKTYLFNGGKFTLLYDFSNLKKGATWKFAYAYAAGAQTKYDTLQFIVEDITIAQPMSSSSFQKLNVSLQRRDTKGVYTTYYKGDLLSHYGFNTHILPPTNLFSCDDAEGTIEELRCYTGPNGSNSVKFTGKKCEETSSLPNDQERFDVSVFPNPSSGIFFINIQNVNFNQAKLHVYNQQGKKVFTQPIATSTENQPIELQNTPSGLYFWQLELDRQLVKKGKIVMLK